ncbi:MAG: DUF1631 family protein [Pseudomonadota bacterium]
MSEPDRPEPNPELAADAFKRLIEGFTQRVSSLFDQMVDILLGMAEKSSSLQEQHLYFDAMRILRASRDDILGAFEKNLREQGQSAESLASTAALPQTLELVSNEAMDENVVLTGLAQRIANRAGDELQSMATRIESIAAEGAPATITPEAALRALETALRHASLEFETRQVVYRVLEKQAVHSLANVYAEMNQWLVHQGVLPTIPVGYLRRAESRPGASPSNAPAPVSLPAEAASADAPSGLRPFSMSDMEHAAVSSPAPMPPGSFGGAGGMSSALASFGETSHYLAPLPASLATPWLGQQLEQLGASPSASGATAIGQSLSRIAPALSQAASADHAVLHDRRHPMRRALTLLSDLVIDLESEDQFTDIGEEIARMIGLMDSRAASGPGFWLHVIKYLQYLKEEIHNRLWNEDAAIDHQERIKIARRLATRQIQLQMRGKRVSPTLHRMLTHLMGPALAILLLRHRHERDSAVLRNALQTLHELIESVQDMPASIEDMHYLEHASGVSLIRRLRAFLGTFSGFDPTLIETALDELHNEHQAILGAIEVRNNQLLLPVISIEAGLTREEHVPLPAIIGEVVDAELVEEEDTQAEPPPPVELPEPDMGALDNLALDALLERLQREHRFAWFQIHVCEGCVLRRLMFSAYDPDKRVVTFVNVRQEPSVMLSVVDFDAALRAGLTRPIFDDPSLQILVRDYVESRSASTGTH